MSSRDPQWKTSIYALTVALIIISTLVVGARLALGILQRRSKSRRLAVPLTGEEAWLLTAHVFSVVTAVLYLIIILRWSSLVEQAPGGVVTTVSTDDYRFVSYRFFAVTLCFLSSLWAAKFSFLWMYRPLFRDMPVCRVLWYLLLAFCTVLLIVCYVTVFTVCTSLDASFNGGTCNTPFNTPRGAITFWFCYVADILTDLLIMAFPMQLLRHLRLPLARKVGIACLFCAGWVCIVISSVRAWQLNKVVGQPDLQWLALWGTIETSVVVMTVSAPGIYRVVNALTSTRRSRERFNERRSRCHRRNRNSDVELTASLQKSSVVTSCISEPAQSDNRGNES
ncbi:hypothetical protein PpBr36_03478 [Pyricularia pennisetigena]|uniref:hypothetical protein n=1 Tax=Pyricularia pennisetigena TaxID=1578925 RepID=UPI00114E9957|nr:hypothetical protein PpBr36_03478 [Pyricularia pennisetigena]TLS31457.1 hypothetical protein PpBr36_03478 [Pyricularia pennisetigena]